MLDPLAEAKRAVGRAAADRVPDGIRLGLGTGSTVAHFLDALGERIAGGLRVVGVATSSASAAHARLAGIPLVELDDLEELDLTIDGADEVDPNGNLIKGGGGALTREKIVAAASRSMLVIVTAEKLVPRLGATFRLPIEVLPFGAEHTRRHIAALGLESVLRRRDGEVVRTDNGNFVLDARLDAGQDLAELERSIGRTPGVVESGLFLNLARSALVAEVGGAIRELRFDR